MMAHMNAIRTSSTLLALALIAGAWMTVHPQRAAADHSWRAAADHSWRAAADHAPTPVVAQLPGLPSPATQEPPPPDDASPDGSPTDAASGDASAPVEPADSGDGKGEKPSKTDPNGFDETVSFFQKLDLGAFWRENGLKQWGVLLGAIFGGLVVGRIAAAVFHHLGSKWEGRGWHARASVFNGLASPTSLFALAIGLTIGLAYLRMGPPLRVFASKTLMLIYAISVFWAVFNLIEALDVLLRRLVAGTSTKLDDNIVPLIRKTLRIFLVIFAALFVAQSVFDQDIGAWLAGLGIAGIAVSLAAQDSLKNLFGSITILFDQPFCVGERIVYAGYDGIIEEIGFRSTKVRTLTGNLVTIPNSNIVNDPVENIGRRPTIRRLFNVTITYDTPREKIGQAVQILRDILDEDGIREPIHPVVGGDELPPRVYFNDYNAESLNIMVIYWYAPPAYWDYMEHAERLNLRIFEEFERAGIEFAFPTQTLYLAGDPNRRLTVDVNRGQ
jgi:MscS family membrane protein